MNKPVPSRYLQIIGSVFGVALLVALVASAAAIFATSSRDFWVFVIAGLLFTVPCALAAWHGSLLKEDERPQSLSDWLQFFVASAMVSVLFVLIDVLIVHPGISLIFTIGSLSMTFIALPGAARAWVIDALSARRQAGDSNV